MKCIAVIQYKFPLQSYTRDLVLAFAHHGYTVEFFIDHKSMHSGFIDLSTLVHPRIHVNILRGNISCNRTSFGHRIDKRLLREWRFIIKSPYWAVSRDDRNTILRSLSINVSETIAIIGIEKSGLLLAGEVGPRLGTPVIYYSLELFFRDTDAIRLLRHSRILEKKYHRRSSATIIQDPLRGAELCKRHQLSNPKVIYFPISVTNTSRVAASTYWHDKFGLRPEQRVILYFGNLGPRSRNLTQLIQGWQFCSPENVLVLHGEGDVEAIEELCHNTRNANAFVSTSLVAERMIPVLIASADIGLCLYENADINERLTAFSSQKVALYLREGVPLLSSANESYDKLYSLFRCGEPVEDPQDLVGPLAMIFNHYERYSSAARNAFDTLFSFEHNFQSVLSEIEQIPDVRARSGRT